jgi:hypothetical protein
MLVENLSKILILKQSCIALVVASDLKVEIGCGESSSKAPHFAAYSLPYLGSGAIAVCEDFRRSLNSGEFNQDEVNEKLKDAIRSDRKYLVEFLLNLSEGLRPDQNGVNQALVYAAESNNLAILELLLNQPFGKLRPDQKTIEATIEEISKRVSCDEFVAKAQLSMKGMLKKSLPTKNS